MSELFSLQKCNTQWWCNLWWCMTVHLVILSKNRFYVFVIETVMSDSKCSLDKLSTSGLNHIYMPMCLSSKYIILICCNNSTHIKYTVQHPVLCCSTLENLLWTILWFSLFYRSLVCYNDPICKLTTISTTINICISWGILKSTGQGLYIDPYDCCNCT